MFVRLVFFLAAGCLGQAQEMCVRNKKVLGPWPGPCIWENLSTHSVSRENYQGKNWSKWIGSACCNLQTSHHIHLRIATQSPTSPTRYVHGTPSHSGILQHMVAGNRNRYLHSSSWHLSRRLADSYPESGLAQLQNTSKYKHYKAGGVSTCFRFHGTTSWTYVRKMVGQLVWIGPVNAILMR